MPTSDRRPAASLLVACGLLAALPAFAATPQQLAERAVAQEGLSIGLAANVLQSQLEVVLEGFDGSNLNKCNQLLTGGPGSAELVAFAQTSKTVTQASVTVFYDHTCTQPYIEAVATLTEGASGNLAITETATYNGPTGKTLGTLTLSETAKSGQTTLALLGTGTFTAVNTSLPPVSLGLQCALPNGNAPFPCVGGVAQDFPALKRSIASLTKLTLTVATKKPRPVTFSGDLTRLLTGDLGALSIGQTKSALTIEGTGTHFGSTSASGNAGGFMLFPPTPTGWSVSDAAHDVVFSIAVVSPTKKNLVGSVKTISSGTLLATFALDKSGTGTVSYGTGGKHPVTGWTLSE